MSWTTGAVACAKARALAVRDGTDCCFLDEVPAQYRDQYRALNALPIVPPTPEPQGPAAVRIRIARINVDSAVVEGDNWQALQLGVGHHIGSANPGERGNMVLSGHNDVYGEVFRHLDKLQRGDPVIVNTMTREYTYIVQGWQIVRPDAVWVLEARGNERWLTLISCYPYQIDTHRIVVFATLQT
jgi:sortase A